MTTATTAWALTGVALALLATTGPPTRKPPQ
jgi:hypothetical protein